MNMRKITSLTALVSFFLLVVTSIILYIVPAGRVAYWSGWRLWSLSKEQWGAVHINLGLLFFLSIVLHIFYNWAPIVNYLKNRNRQMRIFTADFNLSLLVTLLVFFGTLAGIPPFSSVIQLGAAISETANQQYGEPPYGHAELSPLQDFSEKIKVELAEGMALLQAAGIKVSSPRQTVQEIATLNGLTPKELYLTMKPAALTVATKMPEEAVGGTGNRTLAQLSDMYQLNTAEIIVGLGAKNIQARLGMTMKEIAAANGLDPHAVYAEIHLLVSAK